MHVYDVEAHMWIHAPLAIPLHPDGVHGSQVGN